MTVAMPVEIYTHTGSLVELILTSQNVYNVFTFIFIVHVAITVMFSETTYSVNEGDGSAQIGLVLSGPSSTDTTVQVTNTDGSATGEYCSILINY